MTSQASVISHVIDLECIDLPHQNNATNDGPRTSTASPDLAQILAGFNERSKPADEVEECETLAERREFGRLMAHFNFAHPENSIVDNATRLEPLALPKEPPLTKPKKTRATKVRVPKEKKSKKKPMTITARSVSAFAPIQDSPENELCTDQSIKKFLTPNRAKIDTATSLQSSTTKIKQPKRPGKRGKKAAEYHRSLASPSLVQRRYELQRLLYKQALATDVSATPALGPSRLISMTKGYWHVSNRCPDGNLTDGGPQDIMSNQEQISFPRDDTLIDLTMLPTRALKRDDSNRACSLVEPASVNELLDLEDSPALTFEADVADFASTQQYLCKLVDWSEEEAGDEDFLISENPPMSISRTNQSLQTSPHYEDKVDTYSGTALISATSRSKRTRRDGDNCPDKRNVSPKLQRCSSPNAVSNIIIVPEVEESVTLPACSSSKSQRETERKLAGESGNKSGDSATRGARQNIIHLDTTDDELLSHSKNPRSIGALQVSASTKSSLARYGRQIDQKDEHDHPIADQQTVSGPRLQESCDTSDIGRARPQQKLDGYWVVPDSEDEVEEITILEALVDTSSTPVFKRPDFESFPTPRLQSELSNYGFKVGKNRAGMVNLLSQCWQAKNQSQASMQSALMSTKSSAQTAGPAILDLTSEMNSDATIIPGSNQKFVVKKARESAAAKADRIAREKILKSEAKVLAAQEKAAKKAAEKEAKKLQKDVDKEAAQRTKIEATRTLFKGLTTLLKTTEGLSWWLKILKYEPIILEDFGDWLKACKNIDTDVDTIRDYFDSKGVCCVKKMTRKGKDRKRF